MAATAAKNFEFEIDVEDVEYLRHGDQPLLARLFKPRGTGPFPAVVELHGGAWCLGDRLQDTAINERLARNGILVAALDFRVPPTLFSYTTLFRSSEERRVGKECRSEEAPGTARLSS